MNEFTTLAVVIVAACTVTYTIVTMIRNHRQYVRQKEALEGYNLTDSVEGEIRLVTMDIDVSIHGQELRLLTDEQKNVIAIATADDLAPLQGEFANSAYMAFYLRTSSQGEKYIVVKDGFSVRAAIMQPDVKEALRDSLLEAMTLLRMEGLKDGTVDITRQCWPTGGNEETEADDEET